jgi:hypothetical protein
MSTGQVWIVAGIVGLCVLFAGMCVFGGGRNKMTQPDKSAPQQAWLASPADYTPYTPPFQAALQTVAPLTGPPGTPVPWDQIPMGDPNRPLGLLPKPHPLGTQGATYQSPHGPRPLFKMDRVAIDLILESQRHDTKEALADALVRYCAMIRYGEAPPDGVK